MSICNGCGGVIGRDCFNPQECEYIAYSNEQYEKQDIKQQVKMLEDKIEQLTQRVEKLEHRLRFRRIA